MAEGVLLDDGEDDSDSDSSLNCMFKQNEPKDKIFYFKSIEYIYNSDLNTTQVVFNYDYANKLNFQSKLQVDGHIRENCYCILFCIGMTSLLWYWMGFATNVIIIEAYHMSSIDLNFWNEFYNEILLEYKYLHPSIGIGVISVQNNSLFSKPVVSKVPLFLYERITPDKAFPSHAASHKKKVLCPLGGGKDSLVVWHLIKSHHITSLNSQDSITEEHSDMTTQIDENKHGNLSNELEPVLLYCCDGLYEFEMNRRIQQVAARTGAPLHIVRHDFRSDLFEKHALSYLYPAGHPWAALVLFDSLLVSSVYDYDEVWLGHERSADEGNGVFYDGREVNHQFDKSSRFLCQVRNYIHDQLQPLITTTKQMNDVMSSQTLTTINNKISTNEKILKDSIRPMDDNHHFSSTVDGTKDLTSQVNIISALSSTWELEIARLFCTEPALHPFHAVFLSCNEPVGESKCEWCLKCEKCCFVYLLMSAWLSPEEVIHNIFKVVDSSHSSGSHISSGSTSTNSSSSGSSSSSSSSSSNESNSNDHNNNSSTSYNNNSVSNGSTASSSGSGDSSSSATRLFDDITLLPIFKRLVGGGVNGMKPFECVGTFVEASAAVELTLYRHIQSWKQRHQQIVGATIIKEEITNTTATASSKVVADGNDNIIFTSSVQLIIPPVLQALCEYLNIPSSSSSSLSLVYSEESDRFIVDHILTKWGVHKQL